MNKKLIVKALCSYRKAKQESLKNNQKNGRTNLVEVRKKQIAEINEEIYKLETAGVIHFLKTIYRKLHIAIHGYKTPKNIDYSFLIGNPEWQSKK